MGDTEKNIADLEDDEDVMEANPPAPQIIESQPPSSNLCQLLKGEGSGKKAHVDDSSDDDFQLRPVAHQQKKNKKQKKQKGQVLSLEEFHRAASQPRETDSGSVADSESEKVSDQEGLNANQGTSKDGWSFEVDEEDVNKLLETEETEDVAVEQASEERTDLEDVFRFDSEMHEDEEEEDAAAQVGEQQRKKSVSVDDLNDALMEETTDESEAEGAAVPIPNKEESVAESNSNAEPAKPILGTSMSSSYASSMESESSTTNSPNPRSSQSKNKNKKGKKKKK